MTRLLQLHPGERSAVKRLDDLPALRDGRAGWLCPRCLGQVLRLHAYEDAACFACGFEPAQGARGDGDGGAHD